MVLGDRDARALAARMADSLFEAMRGGSPRAGGAALLRLDPLSFRGTLSDVSFSGGVSEYIYGGEAKPMAISARSSPPRCARGLRIGGRFWRGPRRASAPP